MAVNKLWPGEALGAQKFHQVWRVYVRSPRTRAGLIVRGLDLSGSNITVHDDNPVLDNNKHTERVVIKDLPATLSSERIHNFLLGFSQLRIKSRILYAKERIGGEEMSPFNNGDRLVYISPNPTPPLPKESVIDGQPCRIWHKSQQNFCKRCDSHGHHTFDVDMCESFNPDEAVIPFRADSNPLSNFFKCSITLDDRVFQSSEHAFQFNKAMFLKSDNLAESIYSASSPREAKTIAAHLISHNNIADWLKINVDVMRKILRAKWNCSGRFRPLKPSSNIHNLIGNPHSSFQQPDTTSSSDTPQLSGTPLNGTSQSSDIAPGDTIHLDSDSTSVIPPPNDFSHSLPSQPSSIQQPSGHIENLHSDTAEKQLDNLTDNDTPL